MVGCERSLRNQLSCSQCCFFRCLILKANTVCFISISYELLILNHTPSQFRNSKIETNLVQNEIINMVIKIKSIVLMKIAAKQHFAILLQFATR